MPELVITGISATGGVILIGLGINLLGLAKLRILNMLPSLAFVALISWLYIIWWV